MAYGFTIKIPATMFYQKLSERYLRLVVDICAEPNNDTTV